MNDNQILAVKLLLEKAKLQITRVGTEKAFALLHLHDALDWTMQYLHHSVERKKIEWTFSKYSKYISENEDKFGPFDKMKADELDGMRNAFKHSFNLPNDARLKYLSVWCEEQIASLLKVHKQIDLSSFTLVDAIAITEVKDEIVLAQAAHRANKMDEAVHHLAVAFQIVIRKVEDSIEEASGERPAITADFTFASSFFMKVKPLGDLVGNGSAFAESWDRVIQSIVHLNANVLISMLGLDAHEYYKFRKWTPRPQRALSGKYHSNIMPGLQERLGEIDYDFCESFVIEAAINASNLIAVSAKKESLIVGG